MTIQIENYFNSAKKWKPELLALRKIVYECLLLEEFKWKNPCYTFNKKNIVLIHAFKDYCALLFFKGALLNDKKKLLIQQTENVQVARQLRFNNLTEIINNKAIIIEYINNAILIEKSGLKLPVKKQEPLILVDELINKFKNNLPLKTAFYKLTIGRQKAYNLFFNAAKQPITREIRIEKNIQKILNGYGLNDCTCGLSKHKPNCDGSHKYI